MNTALWQWVFRSAAAFNFAVAAPFLLAPAWILGLLGFAVPENPLWYALFWWLVLAFGAGYWMVSRDLAGQRGIAAMGVLGKSGVWAIALALWLGGEIPGVFALLACGDLLYAALFLVFLRASRPRAAPRSGRVAPT